MKEYVQELAPAEPNKRKIHYSLDVKEKNLTYQPQHSRTLYLILDLPSSIWVKKEGSKVKMRKE